ncbi:HlyD family efflux transporter periplasmic adaptor subunit, partial [Conexibacter sp. JD483]|uniref:efflux RND transporter periplasmic adaptor subunit n=2 Tax=Conexibacter TaxID=191494 RepID=UPI0028709B27
MRSASRRASLTTAALAAACVAAIVAAVLVVGPSNAASGGAGERLVTVSRGVVQATVSGSGSVAAAKQLDLDFETGGTLQKVYVKPGQKVVAGQLLAQLDPTDAEKTLADAQQALADAEDGSNTTASYAGETLTTSDAVYRPDSETTGDATAPAAGGARLAAVADEPPAATTPTATTPAATTPTETTPDATTPQTTTTPAPEPTQTTTTPAPTTPQTTPTPAPTQTTPATPATGAGTPGAAGAGAGTGAAAAGAAGSGATSAQSLDDLEDAVEDAQDALAATKLRAPIAGTIASVGASAGEEVGGGSSASSSSSSSAASGSGAGAATGAAGASATGSSGASGSSSFITLVDLDAMNLVVPFSESDVGQVRRGQAATVTVNALPDEQLAAHVVSVATLPTTNSSVVSYDVTLRLDQLASGLKSGMTASASVVVDQADGVLNVASAAVSGRGSSGTVTVAEGDERVRQRVTIGIVGDETTQILDGVSAGDQLVVAAAPTATASGAAGAAAGAGRAGLTGGLGGAGGFPGGG